jgi:hypothetical protein
MLELVLWVNQLLSLKESNGLKTSIRKSADRSHGSLNTQITSAEAFVILVIMMDRIYSLWAVNIRIFVQYYRLSASYFWHKPYFLSDRGMNCITGLSIARSQPVQFSPAPSPDLS